MTDFKKDTRTAEEQADRIYRHEGWLSGKLHWDTESSQYEHRGYVKAIIEQVTPRDEFIEELVGHMEVMRKSLATYGPHPIIDSYTNKLQTRARERGYDHE